MEKWSQDVVDIMHWNCLGWQQSTSLVTHFFNPKPRNCPHQIDLFPARNNPSNACLCVLPPTLLSANRVSPLNETLFQSTHYQMKWRLAHCTLASLWRLVIVWPFEDGAHWWDSFFSADGYGLYWQIILNIWQILSPSKSVDVSVST